MFDKFYMLKLNLGEWNLGHVVTRLNKDSQEQCGLKIKGWTDENHYRAGITVYTTAPLKSQV